MPDLGEVQTWASKGCLVHRACKRPHTLTGPLEALLGSLHIKDVYTYFNAFLSLMSLDQNFIGSVL